MIVDLAIRLHPARLDRLAEVSPPPGADLTAFAHWLLRDLEAYPLKMPELQDLSVPLGDHTWGR